ncbi:sigma-70 family RNA polymerase sigma factor [Halobacillus sp. B23F22_1]|uniref:sigma-70 family RNA polymerase sigma factor n=1 Tax=Halobacillus sp. B23F22_1 TaxID=3459514 RepID=UPI00373E308E
MRKEIEKPLQSFLEKNRNKSAVTTALKKPSPKNRSYVNHLFYQYQIEARFVNYVNTALWRQAKDYHKKRKSQPLLIALENVEIISEQQDVLSHLTERDLFEALESKTLYLAVKKLTNRQQFILYAYAVEMFTFQEIADQLGISQQSASKTYQRVMVKLRQTLKGANQSWD